MNIFVAALFIFLLLVLGRTKPKSSNAESALVDSCPPHEWTTHQQLDEDGTLIGEYLACKKCGPLVNLNLGDQDG